MLPESEWLLPTVWLAIIVATTLLIIFITGRSEVQAQRGEFAVRHEVIDECFAKGDMTREECEGGCTSRGGCHTSSSSTASRTVDPSLSTEA